MNKSAQPDEDADWSQATPGVDYLCFDLYMRMHNPRKIFKGLYDWRNKIFRKQRRRYRK